MQFNVSGLLREPIGASRRYAIDEEFIPHLDRPDAARIQGPVQVLRTHRGILALAELASSLSDVCSRCLQPVCLPMALTVEDEFVPSVDPVTGGRLPPPDDPEVFLIDGRHTLDLTESARQAWLLATPMQVLCRADCAGLCPTCGEDRNADACRCDAAPVDSRWSALAVLRTVRNGADEES